MAWRDESSMDPEKTRAYMHSIADQVSESLQLTGLPLDAHGVTGGSDFSCSSIEEWRRAIGHWLTNPEDNRVLIATSILLDGRPCSARTSSTPSRSSTRREDRDTLLRWMLRLALAAKPPTGFRQGHGAGALGRAPRHPRHQARGPAADRRHRPLRGAEGGNEGDLDHRAAPGRERRGRPRGVPRAHPGGGVRPLPRAARGAPGAASSSAARSRTTGSIRASSTRSPAATCATASAR